MPLFTSPLLGSGDARASFRGRIVLFVCWLALVGWLAAGHVFWRDEVRAFTLALSGSNVVEMLRNVHGEGHPALWYLILRGAHELFPLREVLPIAGALIGIAAMAILTFASPFRAFVIAVILFSYYGAFEYVAMARNYGISALVMFALAALYPRVRNSLWLGLILAILCNTNVPSCFLAAAFLLFRFVELLTEDVLSTRRDWLVFGGNVLLAALGAYLCFRTVYPTFNDQAVSPHLAQLDAAGIVSGLVNARWGFSHLGFGGLIPAQQIPVDAILLAISCLGLIRRPAALAAALAALVVLKLFFYFVYVSYYRHEVLYLLFLVSLFWMVANGAGGQWRHKRWHEPLQFVGAGVFLALLVMQTSRVITPIQMRMEGIPYGRGADAARLLARPELSRAIVMADPDTFLETLPYYVDNPLWMLRQQRFGKVVRLSKDARHELSMTDILADAERLHARTGRPVVFLSHIKLQDRREEKIGVMFNDSTVLRPDEVRRFWAATRRVARLRPSFLDEEYDVYVYPRPGAADSAGRAFSASGLAQR